MLRNLVCFAIVMFNIFDCYSTWIMLTLGLGYEVNPVAAYIIGHIGVWAAIPKIALAVLAAVLIQYWWDEHKAVPIIFGSVAALYTLLAIQQVYMMSKIFIFAG